MYDDIPPPPPVFTYPPPPAPPERNGMAIASLVLGILSVLFCWWGLATLAMVTLAIIFGASRVHQSGMAVAGLTDTFTIQHLGSYMNVYPVGS